MIRKLFVAVMALALVSSFAMAQTKAPTKVAQAPIKKTAIDGKTMYNSYCAVCHGRLAKGDGPAASALTKPPADLTRISARNGGTFPEVKVRRYIEGADEVPSHGTRDMPMWGDVFRSLDRDMAQIRISELVDYLKELQTK
jgi:mono/diheme cytochrome c family protein